MPSLSMSPDHPENQRPMDPAPAPDLPLPESALYPADRGGPRDYHPAARMSAQAQADRARDHARWANALPDVPGVPSARGARSADRAPRQATRRRRATPGERSAG